MRRNLLFIFLCLIFGGCASYAATSGQVVIEDDDKMIDIRIGDKDRAAIEDYYRKSAKHKKGLPPGLAKRGGNLPPGLAKRDKLPPGLQGDPLPRELERKLSPVPSSYVRVKVGRDIVLMDKKTRMVLDVVYGIAN
ncbi:MAG: hypothetical protein HY082_00305 [Gammaproteobacteria bacterium]|nr:hypothetical protein [Gammaproteobacteria bacterium]